MSDLVTTPPDRALLEDGSKLGGWWHRDSAGERIICDLCPRECHLKPGDRGFCFVRENRDGQMVLATYGRSTGFCVDPIEKKPLNHFLPGTSVLSFGTAGCNLGCKFCQNWDISKSREVARLSEQATPEMIAAAAKQLECRSVAYTYNDPVIWAEYAIDVARACREVGIQSVAVTAGYISPSARPAFFEYMDAANVNLKAFTEEFYWQLTQSHLQPVLDTLQWLKEETDVWFEITNLIIPQSNDSMDEIARMCDWILERVGDEVPVHFTAFHPDFRLLDRPATPHETLLAAYRVASERGIKYVYVGNVNDARHQSTYCPACKNLLIERDWHALGRYAMRGNRCGYCDAEIAGRFETVPGNWGRRRLPVRISDFSSLLPVISSGTKDKIMAAEHAEQASEPAADSSTDPSGTAVTHLSVEQQRAVHHFANCVVASALLGRPAGSFDATLAGAAEYPVMGAFVTLKRAGKLRACCGFLSMQQTTSLGEAVRHAAVRTATEDHRFPPISLIELPYLSVDVQVLYGPRVVTSHGTQRVEDVQVGRHGLQIRRGNASGLLLPVVAVEHHFSAEEFLRQVCIKAGLPTTAWQQDDTQLVTFEGNLLPGDFEAELVRDTSPSAALFQPVELQRLADHCRTNLIALAEGATPNYYLFNCADATASGVAITVQVSEQPPIEVAKIALRQGFPVQATLFSLVEAAANHLRPRWSPALASQLQVGVTVLYDPAMHGTVEEPRLEGLDPARRALLVMESTRSCWMYDPQASAEELVQRAAQNIQVINPGRVPVYSLAAQSNLASVSFVNVPRPQAGPEVRPPAVAGQFYPADPGELQQLVGEILGEVPQQKQAWPAVMVPHAGLRFSGRLAAQTLKGVRIPETVIIVGPKHTRLGVDWAVAPHKLWQIPGAQIASDPELAGRLAEAIPGLELDALAHLQEHGIEVELPLLARLAPGARVVGIAISGGDFARCRQFAAGLVRVLETLDPQPLLIISSDMNHFATDQENRRLDELALQAMESLDPEKLLETCQQHSISMCGVLPAVAIMEALRQRGQLGTCQRVGYATSADVTGDTQRVVGYAGMLLGSA